MYPIIEALKYMWLRIEIALYKIFADDDRRYYEDFKKDEFWK